MTDYNTQLKFKNLEVVFMKKLFYVCFLSFTLFSLNLFAQTLVQIDVTSITINRIANADTSFTVTATNLPASYQSPLTGTGEALIDPMDRCFPCFLGDVFKTDYISGMNPPRFVSGFNISGSSDNKRVKFTVIGTSPDIVLSPRIPLKKRFTVLTIAARIIGKVEIFDQNTLVAVDENVDLNGVLKAEFSSYRISNPIRTRRAFDFKSFTFIYSR